MTSVTFADSVFESLKGKVVLVTGCSSGIGLATVKRLLEAGGKVVGSDLNDLSGPEKSEVTFFKADVSSWEEQLDVFKKAVEKYGALDHVYANAGVGPTTTLLEEDVDEKGDPLPPKLKTINVNLLGCMYTVKLAIHFLKKNPAGGSIVVTGSGSSFRKFPLTDYCVSKHAVLGLVRALSQNLHPKLPIRINIVAPSWTITGLTPPEIVHMLGNLIQPADEIARAALLFMADTNRHGEMLFVDKGNFWEVEKGLYGMDEPYLKMIGPVGVEGETDERKKLGELFYLQLLGVDFGKPVDLSSLPGLS